MSDNKVKCKENGLFKFGNQMAACGNSKNGGDDCGLVFGECEHQEIAIKDHPLKEEIIEKIENGEVVFS